MKISYLRPVACFAALLTLFVFVQVSVCQERGSITDEAKQLYERIRLASSLQFDNASGWYVVRKFERINASEKKAEIEQLRVALETDLKNRIERDRSFGVETDVEKIKKRNKKSVKEYAADLTEVKFSIERYTIQDQKYRIQQLQLRNNDLSLEELRNKLLSGGIDFSAPREMAWNGELMAIIARSTDSNDDSKGTSSMVFHENMSKCPEFMTFGRDAVQPGFLEKFLSAGMSITTASASQGDEPIAQLLIGNSESAGMQLRINCLPEKGYVIESAQVKIDGVVITDDKYGDFVEVDGFGWMPTKVSRSNFDVDKPGSMPKLRTKFEMLAVNPTKVNQDLPEDFFDVAETERFKALPQIVMDRPSSDKQIVAKTGAWKKWLLVLSVGIVALVAYWRRSK